MKRTLHIGLIAIGLLILVSVALVRRHTTWFPSSRRSPQLAAPVPAPSKAPQTTSIPEPSAPPPALPPRPIAKPLPRPGVGGGSGPASIAFEFKMDPRMTRALHMGDRWISPPTYTLMGSRNAVTVEARARKLGAKPPRGKPTWTPTQPDMVDVSPDEGDEVKITVLREGESQLTVSSGGVSKTLLVKATPVTGGLRVDITQ